MKSLVGDLVEKGKREWMRNGRKQEALKIAETMKNEGMDADTISRLTRLTVDDVLKL